MYCAFELTGRTRQFAGLRSQRTEQIYGSHNSFVCYSKVLRIASTEIRFKSVVPKVWVAKVNKWVAPRRSKVNLNFTNRTEILIVCSTVKHVITKRVDHTTIACLCGLKKL